MKNILLFGAGKSATCLIDYLLKEITINEWQLTVCDSDLKNAMAKIGNASNASVISIFVENDEERKKLIQSADIVISLLPPTLHFLVAKDCLLFNKNLLTASYVDDNLRSLKNDIEKKELLFLCEMGLDPGIDHMSAMKLIHTIKEKGGNITSFKSHCGGLISPGSDNNPWHYKITWNPRNVVLAGRDGAIYKSENNTIQKKYHEVFKDAESVLLDDLGSLEWYPNRDSLSYIPMYSLDGIPTFIRTTLRYPSFCSGWSILVNLGLTDTDDYDKIKDCKTFEQWYHKKSDHLNPDVESRSYIRNFLRLADNQFSMQADFLELNSNEKLPENFTCSADILQYCMENKLAMNANDKDMIVMLHEIEYTLEGQSSTIKSSLIVKGEDVVRTAMAKTVGLPLGIATKLILQGKIKLKGLHIPIIPEIYEPVLRKLELNGIIFNETK